MGVIEIDRAKNAEAVDEPVELLDPIPQVAPAAGGVNLLPFKLALPNGSGQFEATFEIEDDLFVRQIAVRFGGLPAAYYPSSYLSGVTLYPGDRLTITVGSQS